MIYFDNNATTQVAPEVFDAMRLFLNSSYGNPSSAYSFAHGAAKAVEKVSGPLRARTFNPSSAPFSPGWMGIV